MEICIVGIIKKDLDKVLIRQSQVWQKLPANRLRLSTRFTAFYWCYSTLSCPTVAEPLIYVFLLYFFVSPFKGNWYSWGSRVPVFGKCWTFFSFLCQVEKPTYYLVSPILKMVEWSRKWPRKKWPSDPSKDSSLASCSHRLVAVFFLDKEGL